MNNAQISKFKSQLLTRKSELEGLNALSAEARNTVTLDQQSVGRLSRMDAMQAQAMAQAQERQRGAELMRIERALTRIANDDFGFCEDCGDEISEKRLNVDPAALFCLKCANANER
ncbi:TraR/DksA family transcriptional regulator [Maritalea sp.]|uniref:TraR/DksA family transcriptional regulator n=1 Tax=Maritalea sp. TaxID=2003361 RepID=UPI003EF33FEA